MFIIATGRYIEFAEPLLTSLHKYFLNDMSKTVYLFTDAEKVPKSVIRVPQKQEPWPYPTLKRYNYILDAVDKYKISHDYYFYLDVDMLIVDYVGEEILGDLVATYHPGYYNKTKDKFPHERNFISQSFTPRKNISAYYAGAVNGGRDYLKMAKQITEWVAIDQKHGYIPQWHDETYLNKYLALNKPTISLNPSYCYPDNARDAELWGLTDIKPKILCLYKDDSYARTI